MASNPASASDLIARSLRTLTSTEQTVGATLLNDAFTILVTEAPAVVARLDADPVDANFVALVVQIECAMVLRVLANPDGVLEETGDDYTRRLDAARSTGALYLSSVEAALLSASDGASDGAFTIKPAGLGPFATRTLSSWPWF
jgi:hypothetical protein